MYVQDQEIQGVFGAWKAPAGTGREKGQQTVLIGALYRGADPHVSFKAGGNETAQLKIPGCGIVTTSEKYTIAHSKRTGVCFFDLLCFEVG